jgi:hypothetical protein
MRFNYRRYVTDNGIAHRPVVALTINGPKGVVCWDTLVDTGSDITLFPAVIAEDIGIDLAGAEESAVRGIGEHSVETRDTRVELELSDGVEVYRWQAEGELSHFRRRRVASGSARPRRRSQLLFRIVRRRHTDDGDNSC